MKEFFDKWEKELDEKLPGLREDIISEPIPEKKPEFTVVKPKKPLLRYMSIACSLAAVIVLCICIIPLLRIKDPSLPIDSTASSGGAVPKPDTPPAAQGNTSLITVEINPRVMFVSDPDGRVTNVIATNEDGDIVLSSEGFDESVMGKDITEAIISYVKFATVLGYIDPKRLENTVKITSCDDELSKETLKKSKEKLEAHFEENGISATVNDVSATVERICEINEIEKADKISDVIDKFNGKSKLFSERVVEELDEKDLESYYLGMVTDNIRSQLKESIRAAEDIIAIASLNQQIIEKCHVDYWLVKEFSHIDKELEGLVEEMTIKLDALEQDYGIAIQGTLHLYSYSAHISPENLKELEQSLESFENIEDYKSLYKLFGKELDDFDKLDNPLTSREEIAEEKKNFIKQQHTTRLDKNNGKGKQDMAKPEGSVENEERDENEKAPLPKNR